MSATFTTKKKTIIFMSLLPFGMYKRPTNVHQWVLTVTIEIVSRKWITAKNVSSKDNFFAVDFSQYYLSHVVCLAEPQNLRNDMLCGCRELNIDLFFHSLPAIIVKLSETSGKERSIDVSFSQIWQLSLKTCQIVAIGWNYRKLFLVR